MSRQETVHIVVNPAAGSRTAKEFVREHIEPLLRSSEYSLSTHETESIGDAARIAREIGLNSLGDTAAGSPEATHTVVLVGGDGTAHEFIEGIYSLQGSGAGEARWNLVILPLGTANALYASTYPPGTPLPTFSSSTHTQTQGLTEDVLSKLHSLAAFLNPNSSPTPLPISNLTITGPKTSPAFPPITIPSHVVISTCLHSNLLATAETLRSEYPGVERFSVAAARSAGKLYPAQVTLYPSSKGHVEVYDPASSVFVPSNLSALPGPADGAVGIEDDFAYFLTSATCPRLEPTFVISPLLRRIPQAGSIDVTILRPSRDPRIQSLLSDKSYASIQAVREANDQAVLDAVVQACGARSWEVLKKAYEDGAHVDLTYTADGGVESTGKGERVVEVYRCSGFDWRPLDREDKSSHLVCADGSLEYIPAGGSAQVRLDDKGSGLGIYLWT